MKILVVGGGGREHALVWRLSQDRSAHEIFCAPGNAGTAAQAVNLDIGAEDAAGLASWARAHRPDLVVVGPEAPLCGGLADVLAAAGLRVFGPVRAAARIEGSKHFAKEVMAAAGVPTARAESFTRVADALAALARCRLPVVVKADGLAAGKGVLVCGTRAEAEAAVRGMLEDKAFGVAGSRLLLEEFLEGEEASLLALVDGERIALLPSARDHKRLGDGDTGPNTGGMGACSPAPGVTPATAEVVLERILRPVVGELRRRGIVYRGVLYAGLMIGREGPKVLEFNCRFGDPETQAVLPRLGGELAPLLAACAEGRLDPAAIEVREGHCVAVVMASRGYPGAYPRGLPVSGLEEAARCPGTVVFHAGTREEGGRIVTAGGRVLTVAARGATLCQAADRAYAAAAKIHFDGAHYRRDIARRAPCAAP
jgi:phosphoribosylamine--glycine ligase